MTTIVLINGEKQVGKSTFANHLANLLFEQHVNAEVYSFVGIYEKMLAEFFRYTGVTEVSYEQMKKMQLVPNLPIDGRTWMIQMGNASRALHPYILPAIFDAHRKTRPEVDVWIIENWGLADEYQYFVDTKTAEDRLFTVHLNERASRKYASGEQYDGDNRASQEALSVYINPKVNHLAAEIDEDNDYPIDTIALQFHTETSMELPDTIQETNQIEAAHDESAAAPDEPHTAEKMEALWKEGNESAT